MRDISQREAIRVSKIFCSRPILFAALRHPDAMSGRPGSGEVVMQKAVPAPKEGYPFGSFASTTSNKGA